MKDFKKISHEAIILLQSLIKTPSISREEESTADIIEENLHQKGFDPNRSGNNVWVEKSFGNHLPTLLLNSHHDTVKPVTGWQRDPFLPVIEGEKLFGLGSNDAGASLVSLLQCFLLLSQEQQPYNLVFLASAEEEISGKGGIDRVLPDLPSIDFGVVGEPTQLQPAIAEKGLMVVDVVVSGKSGHAARNEGVNSIYKALDIIKMIKEMEFQEESEWLGKVKMSVTQINAGTQHNVVPDKCELVVDVRSTDKYSNEDIANRLKKELDAEVIPRSKRLDSSGISITHPFIRKCVEMGMTPFGSPTLSDQSLMQFNTVKIGPGNSARSHTADEFIYLNEIQSGIETYYNILNQLNIQS